MKKIFPLFLLFSWQVALTATFNSNVISGNWSNAGTWTLTSGTDPDGIPDADDDVIILPGHTVTLFNTQACTNLTVQGSLTASSGGNLAQSGATSIAGTLNLNNGVLDFSQVVSLTGIVNFNSGTYTFNSGGFSGTGTVTVTGGTVNFNTGSSLADNLAQSGGSFQGNLNLSVQNLTISGGTFDPSGNATVSGSLSWSGGTIGSSGGTASSLDVAGAATLSGASKSLTKKTLSLNGGGAWTGGNIFTSNSPVLNVPAGQSLAFNSASNLSLGSSTGTVNLAGTLDKLGSGTLSVFAALNNTGAVDVQAGALALSGNGTHTGSFTVATAEGLQFNGGTHSLPSVTGTGSLRVGGATVTLSSDLNMPLNMTGGNLSGTFNISTTTATISGGTLGNSGTATLSGDLAISSGGTFSPSGTASIGGSLALSGGTFDPSGSATVSGSLSWSGGTIGSSGGTASSVDVAGAATLSGASKSLTKKTLSLNGGATWTSGNIFTSNSPVLNVPAGQTLAFNSASNLSLGSSTGTVNLAGTLDKLGSGTLSIFAALNNTGAVDVQAGALALSGNGTHTGSFTVASAEGLQFNSGTHSLPSVTGPGSLRVGGATVTLSADLNMPLNMTGGNLSGTFNISTTTATISGGTLGNGGTATLSGDLAISSGSFSPSGTASIGGSLALSGGTFDPSGSATVSGSLSWSGGTIGSSGGTASSVDVVGAATLSGGSKSLTKKTLSLNGGATWTGGNIISSNSPVLNVPAGQTLAFNSAANLSLGSSTGTVNLAGTLDKQGSGTLSVLAALNNTGAVDVQAGALALSGSGTHTGSFTVATADGLQFNGGTHSLPSVTGTGSLRVGGATVTLSSDLSVPLNLTVGTLSSTSDINTATVTISGGTFSPSGTASIGGSLALSGGTFDPSGSATVSGPFSWSGGTIGSSGGTASSVDVVGAATLSGGSKSLTKKTLSLNGGATWTGGNLFTSNSPVLNVPAGQSLAFNSAANLSLGSSTGTVNLAGTLDKQGSGTLSVFAALNNTGVIILQQGTLDVNGTFTQNGTVKGISTLDVAGISFSNTGNFSPGTSPGMLTVAGNFSNNGGSLDIEIGGTTAGTDYDRLVITGTASLSGTGTINLSLVNGYTPQAGHSFTILDAVSMSGTFASPVSPFVFAGANWDISYNNAQGTITLTVLSPLPVELVEFSGKQLGEDAQLSWQTASEQENAGFKVEKSLDGVDFQAIGFVNGNGSSLVEKNYSFLDKAFTTSAYYRLQQMDISGDKSFSKIVFLSKGGSEAYFKLFPNPVEHDLTVQFQEVVEGTVMVRIVDAAGRKHLEEHWIGLGLGTDSIISLNGLPSGVYWLIINTSKGVRAEQFVKFPVER